MAGALVVDASALGDYLLGRAPAPLVAEALVRHEADLHIPELCDVEVAAILRRRLLAGELAPDRAADAVIDLADLPLTRHGHLPLLGRILQLRENFSSYDATYVALTETLAGTLVTTDGPLARAIRAHLELSLIDASED